MRLTKSVLRPLETAIRKYTGSIDAAERKLVPYVEFDFSIDYHYADGWLIFLKELPEEFEYTTAAPMDVCLQIIEEKGVLSFEDFQQNTI